MVLGEQGFPGGSAVKKLPATQEMRRMWVRSLGQEDPLEDGMATDSSILAGKISQRSLAGHGPQGHKKSDSAEATKHAGKQG